MLLRTIRASGHGFYLIGSVRSLREKSKVLRSQSRLKKRAPRDISFQSRQPPSVVHDLGKESWQMRPKGGFAIKR